MVKSIPLMKILLVQIRKDAMKQHEYQCVLEKTGLDASELVSFDIFDRLVTHADLDGCDALIVGGSGGYCVSEREIVSQIEAMEEVIREARRRGMPILGLCFGHHLIAEALGGEVKQDRERQEVGTFMVERLPASDVDPVFSHLPYSFAAQEGHKDHVTTLPPSAIHLAQTSNSPFQAFTFPGEPIYSMQLHPELAKPDVFTRLEFYRDLYLKSLMDASTTDAGVTAEGVAASGQNEFEQIMAKTFDTPEAEKILQLFVNEVVRAGKRYPQP